MRKVVVFLVLFFLCVGTVYSEYSEIDKATFDRLLDAYCTSFRFYTIEIYFKSEGFSKNDHQIRYYTFEPNRWDTYKKQFTIEKDNLEISIAFEDESVDTYRYSTSTRNEFLRNLNYALQFLELINRGR